MAHVPWLLLLLVGMVLAALFASFAPRLWFVGFGALVLAGTYLAVTRWRRAVRRAESWHSMQCSHCGYDLRGGAGSVCSECGAVNETASEVREILRPREKRGASGKRG